MAILCLFSPGSISGRKWLETDKGGDSQELTLLFNQVGFMKTGKIVALEVDHYSNAGNSLDLSHGVCGICPCFLGQLGGHRWAPSLLVHTGIGLGSCLLLLQ